MRRLLAAPLRGRASEDPVESIPRGDKLILLAFQHVLVAYAGAVAVPLVIGAALNLDKSAVAFLVSADLLVTGIAILIQNIGFKGVGIRLPLVLGSSFVTLPSMILIGQTQGLATAYGAVIVAGIFGFLFAPIYAKLTRFLPPLVSGTLIVVVGVSLLSAGAHLVTGNDPTAPTYAQPSRIGLVAIVVLLIVIVLKLGKGFAGQLAVLLALVAGTIIAVPFHLVSFAGLGEGAAFGVPRPFRFGAPVFELGAAIAITVGFLVTLIENLANLQLISRVVDRPLGEKDVARAFRADSLATALGGVFSSYPYASFSQNIGIVSLTGVKSRFVVAAAGVVFICLGIIPKFGLIVASVPDPVIGGAALVMFALVVVWGLRIVATADLSSQNMMIIAVTIAVGLAPTVVPDLYRNFPNTFQVVVGTSVTSAAIVAISLNLIFNELAPRLRRRAAPDDPTSTPDGDQPARLEPAPAPDPSASPS